MAEEMREKLPEDEIDLTKEEVEELKRRVQASNLSPTDQKMILSVLRTILMLRLLVERKKSGMLALLRRIFGVKTEKKDPSKKGSKKNGAGKGNPKGKGHGKNGKHEFPGAKRVFCNHGTLKTGDQCPECGDGILREGEPATHQHWSGHAPLQVIFYELERFICNKCRAVYRAALPDEVQQNIHAEEQPAPDANEQVDHEANSESPTAKEDHPSQPSTDPDITPGPSRSREHGRERSYDVSANVMVSLMRYAFGVPNYRLAWIQKAFGMPLAAGTQWGMIVRVFAVVAIIYRCIWRRSANSSEFLNDDTRMKILAFMVSEGKGTSKKQTGPPPKNKDGSTRKAVQTTCILAELGGHRTVLYATGHKNAGENLNDILALRDPGLARPRQMSDGLAANVPADHDTDQSNCLDHARRKFYDIRKSDEEESDYVLSLFGMVYHNDKQTRGMSREDRLAYHQLHSTHVMDEIEGWMGDVYDITVEPNSNLGSAINYMSKRWTKLTKFLRVPGVPLANAECERKIKSIIPHRKGSLFFNNLFGAFVGDAMMTTIQTCVEAKKSPAHYLNALCRNAAAVAADPDSWLPWNYEENLTPT